MGKKNILGRTFSAVIEGTFDAIIEGRTRQANRYIEQYKADRAGAGRQDLTKL